MDVPPDAEDVLGVDVELRRRDLLPLAVDAAGGVDLVELVFSREKRLCRRARPAKPL